MAWALGNTTVRLSAEMALMNWTATVLPSHGGLLVAYLRDSVE